MTGGAVVGLLLGAGLACVLLACTSDPPARRRARWRRSAEDLLASAGLGGVGAPVLAWACVVLGATGGLVVAAVGRSVTVAAAFAGLAASAPVLLLRGRAARRRSALQEVWPDVVDDLVSAVRAGASLPEALEQVGAHDHPVVGPAFVAFGRDHRATGSFGTALDALKQRLADPVGDRVVESLRLAREVGGSDLGRLLRTLSTLLREDARLRAELEARQGWTVNAARLASAAPWFTLAFLSLRPDAVAAYDTPAGAVVLLAGAVVTALAYRLMLTLGRLPDEPRVLR